MVRFTRTGLEGLTNQAIHEIAEDRKKAPVKEEAPEVENTQAQFQEEQKEITGSTTYGTNSTTHRALFNGSYHTFTTNSSNQMQCTCCPEPILLNVNDLDISKKDKESYLSPSTGSYLNVTKTKEKPNGLY